MTKKSVLPEGPTKRVMTSRRKGVVFPNYLPVSTFLGCYFLHLSSADANVYIIYESENPLNENKCQNK